MAKIHTLDNSPTDKSKLVWREGESGQESLAKFLQRCPPSKARRPPGGDGWIWVISRRHAMHQKNFAEEQQDIELAKKEMAALHARCEEIDTNDKISKRASKTSGPTKKQLTDAAIQRTEQTLSEIGKRSSTCGKWMFFQGKEYIDYSFKSLATSLINGPLSELKFANCHTIKVATADDVNQSSNGNGIGSIKSQKQGQLICLYFDSIWESEHAKEVLEVVVKQHGLIPNSAKADLYTMLGIYHDELDPSPDKKQLLRPTLYRAGEIFNYDVMREWQAEAREKAKAAKMGKGRTLGESSGEASSSSSRNKIRKTDSNARREAVDPNVFWPAPSSTSTTAATTAAGPAPVFAAPVIPPNNAAAAEGDESVTESEDEEAWKNVKPMPKRAPLPLAAAASNNSPAFTSVTSKQTPAATREATREATAPAMIPATAPATREAATAPATVSAPAPNLIKETPKINLKKKRGDRSNREQF